MAANSQREQAVSSVDSISIKQSKKLWGSQESITKPDQKVKQLMAKMKLKLVLGWTFPMRKCICLDSNSGLVGYTASNVVVIFDTLNIRQIRYLVEAKHPIETLSFSYDGKLIVTGESGHMPPVRVWDVELGNCVACLYGHEYGVSCVSFSPKGNLIASIGHVHDRSVIIWSWPQKEKISTNRFAEDITGMCFSPDSLFFVTCGVHHLKFWYPEQTNSVKKTKKERHLLCPALYGRPAILGDHKTETFVDVMSGNKSSEGFVYVATESGEVVQLSSPLRSVVGCRKSVGKGGFSSVYVYDDQLFVASKDGIIYFYNSLTLELKTQLSMPEGKTQTRVVEPEEGFTEYDYAKTREFNIHLCFDHVHNNLTVLSSDGRLSIWDVKDLQDIQQRHYFLCHHGGISCSDILQGGEGDMNRKRETVVTVSPGDSTIRLWYLDLTKAVCCNGVAILLASMKSPLTNNSDSKEDINSESSGEEQSGQGVFLTATKACSRHLVTGDNDGHVVVYGMDGLETMAVMKYHSRAVTCLEIFNSQKWKQNLLVSGGRDRKIVIYDMENNFKAINMMQIHSGSVTILRLYQTESRLMLISGGKDRSLVLSDCPYDDLPSFAVRYNRFLPSSAVDCVFNDQELSLGLGMLSGEIGVYCLSTLNLIRSFSSSCGDASSRIEKLAYHPKHNLIIAACSNRCINVICFRSGDILATATSHAATTSGLHCCINNHCIISCSSDGCIFIWGFSVKEDRSNASLKTFEVKQNTMHCNAIKSLS